MQIKAAGKFDQEGKQVVIEVEIVPDSAREHDLLKPLASQDGAWDWQQAVVGDVLRGRLVAAVPGAEAPPEEEKKSEFEKRPEEGAEGGEVQPVPKIPEAEPPVVRK